MPDTRPGDQVYVKEGALLRSAVDNGEEWNERIMLALVIGSPMRYVELDDEITGLVTVFIAEKGMFLVEEAQLMTPDEYANPARLFPLTRLREG